MPRWATHLTFVLLLATPGCGLIQQATHVVAWQSCSTVDEYREQKRNREWAEAAWNSIAWRLHHPKPSDDYADGFKAGYAEYLYHGAEVLPALPPNRYRTLEYQTQQGYRAIQEWYAGYGHGVGMASASGVRRLVTGPAPPDRLEVPQPSPQVIAGTGGSPAAPWAGSGYTPGQWKQPKPQP